ncbi:MAG: sugar ABC transporter permease [Clostridiales bacterium]|nr:sugar ABC transporter permease [Clostridiales bacterium]
MRGIQTEKNCDKIINYRRRKQIIFYASLVALPLLQFCIFYFYVNFSSIFLGFQEYTKLGEMQMGYTFAGLKNFSVALDVVFGPDGLEMLKNSSIFFVVRICVGYGLALFFSFYIYKKYFASEIFRVFLFLPSIISSIIFGFIFKYLVNDFYVAFMELFGQKVKGLLAVTASAEQKLGVVIFYNIWVSFGISVLMFSNSMGGIDESIVESAHLDGTNLIQEMWFITLPCIWGTLSSFFIVSLTGIFTDGMSLHSIFGDSAPVKVFGYYLYVSANHALPYDQVDYLSLPKISAVGLVITFITVPITLTVRHLLDRFGPSTD